MEKLTRNDVIKLSKQPKAITVKRPLLQTDALLFAGISLLVMTSIALIVNGSINDGFFLLSVFLILGIIMVVISLYASIKMPKITIVFYDGKMVFYTKNGVYYSITPSELIGYNISGYPMLVGSQSKIYGLLNLTCECGSFESLYVYKIQRAAYFLDAFKREDVLEEANYTPTYSEVIQKYLCALLVSLAIMFGFILSFRVPAPWSVVVLILFPVVGFVSFIYFLVKILKVRKNYKK
ncbi:MAG: hypothetical protein K2J89_02340 [Clostridia bacterium]|nr:hypothetical protein [Clostridia bacterium]